VMVELGNMRSHFGAARMTRPEGRDRYARSLAAAVRDYLGRG
jgi:N-acetylmuramoyl-L-alanine amidase